MYSKKQEEDLDCGIRIAFKIFGGKWKMCILDAISRGIVRPALIQKAIGIAPLRVIEMQLAELLADGVLEKRIEEGIYPKKSMYFLTPFGETILPVLTTIDRWGTEHSGYVKSRMAPQPDMEIVT
ncbi:transcriptional regulator [Pedobacter yulinensis]|uniref:Transcriptional regulator n=1 Tax=Pedobacter yulinensis TaxID=2126353 RepID=A0A2T3HMI7_9SPHI|nr:helix-turn-helix domain-containing protein [Pedobacter yulinensis]PST83646.1 transcriptional regulator [Pedobacter yulinensis]